jgi:predicted outer membrane repeat protein
MLRKWWKSVARALVAGSTKPAPKSKRTVNALSLEALEGREVPNAYVVTNTLDDGSAGSFRWAVSAASTNPGPDTITFDPHAFASAQTIALTKPLELSSDVAIGGPAAGSTLSTNTALRIDSGVNVSLTNLTVTRQGIDNEGGNLTATNCGFNGNQTTSGAIVNNGGTLNLQSCSFDHNYSAGNGGAISSTNGSVTLTDCSFTHNASGLNGPGSGGALASVGGVLVVTGCAFSHDQAGTAPGSNNGGAIYASNASVTVTGSSFDTELAVFGNGGAIDSEGGTLTVTNSTVQTGRVVTDGGGTIADGGFGGAIYATGLTTLTGDVFRSNSADVRGGALGTAGTVTVTDCDFTSNVVTGVPNADGNGGAGIDNTGSLSVNRSAFEVNTAYGTGSGGGIENESSGTLTVTGSYFGENSVGAGNGGGIDSAGALTVLDSSFWSNSTSSYGGNIATSAGTAVLLNTTLSAGQAGAGGGLGVESGTVRVTNCTIAQNSATTGGGIDVGGGAVVLANTIVANNSTDIAGALTANNSIIAAPGAAAITGANNLFQDPKLLPLGTYGGPLPVYNLDPTSPAVAGGSIPLAVDASGQPLTTDQRGTGFARVQNGTVDIGALETKVQYLVVNSTRDVPDPGRVTLRDAIGAANLSGYPTVITFDPTVFAGHQTITLDGTELLITNLNLTISAPAGGLTLDANHLSRAIEISAPLSLAPTVQVAGQALRAVPSGTVPATVALTGFTIINGQVSGSKGGGILDQGILTLTDCTLSGNTGGLDIENVPGTSSGAIAGCTFTNNTGEGVRFAGASLQLSDSTLTDNSSNGLTTFDWSGAVTVTGCTVSGNGGNGIDSGIFAGDLPGNGMTLSNSTITHNAGTGLWQRDGNVTVTNCDLSHNAEGFDDDWGNASFTDCTINSNASNGASILDSEFTSLTRCSINDNGSSALYVLYSGVSLNDSTLVGNRAQPNTTFQGVFPPRGGAIEVALDSGVTLTNCTLANNSATDGGAIYVDSDVGFTDVALTNCTVTGNTAAAGAGIFLAQDAHALLINTILAGNTNTGGASADLYLGGASGQEYLGGPSAVAYDSLLGAVTNPINLFAQNTPLNVSDPLLAPLGNNGGSTITRAPLPGSPAIDGGSSVLATNGTDLAPLLSAFSGSFDYGYATPTWVPTHLGTPLTTDQTGAARIVGASVDIGAVEFDPATIQSVDTTTALSAPTVTYGADGTVTVTVRSATLTPTGSVALSIDGGPAVTQQLTADGTALFAVTHPVAGDHTLSATYVPTGTFLGSTATGTLHVDRATQTIQFAQLADHTYGDPSSTLSASVSAGLPVVFRVLSGPATVSGNVLSIIGAGTVTVEASQGGDANDLAAAPVDVSFTVAPAPLTVTANTLSRVYGAVNPTLTASYSGFQNGETLATSGISSTPLLTTSATATSAPGSYPIAAALGSLTATNYSFRFVPGTLSVTPAPLTASAMNVAPIAGAPFSGPVATFANADPFGSPASYSATITWGDGGTSAGLIADSGGGQFTVSGSHTYADPRSDTFTVQITHALGYVSPVSVSGTATVRSLGADLTDTQAQRIGYWHGPTGQALILSFNGGSTATALGNWLATSFPNLYGPGAGTHNLTGQTNAAVAALFQTLYAVHQDNPDIEVLATALNVYATTTSLGGPAGTADHFRVTPEGLGAELFNVGTDGAAVGVANGTQMNVYQMLVAANQAAVNGVLDGGADGPRAQVEDVFEKVTRTQYDQTEEIGFWHRASGQGLILSFNGGVTATALGNWLAATFPNLYGAGAGTHNLTGQTNAQVAAFFQSLWNRGGDNPDVQVLATALNVYATTLSLGGTVAQGSGFLVSNEGLGAVSYNLGSGGTALGVATGTTLNVYEMLLAVNQSAVNGVLYGGNAGPRDRVEDLFENLNRAGD